MREYNKYNTEHGDESLRIGEIDLHHLSRIFVVSGAIAKYGDTRKKYLLDDTKIKKPYPNPLAQPFYDWFSGPMLNDRCVRTAEALEYQEDPETKERKAKREREEAHARSQAEEQERERQQDKERVEQMLSTLSHQVGVLAARIPPPQTEQQQRESAEKDRRIAELERKLREAAAATAVKPASKKDNQEPDDKDRTIKDLEKKLAEKEAAAIRAAAAGGAHHFVVRGGGAHGGLGPVVDGAVTTTKKKDQAQERPSFFSELSDQFAWWMGTASSVLGGEPAAKKHKGGDGAP